MFFANLGLGEFLALFSAISAGIVALYLLDRSRRHQVVSTLRFWKPAELPTDVRQRRKIQQPWSLILQLLSIALLLLAIAQLRVGARDSSVRDHVLLLDTSAWMGAKTDSGTIMQDARKQSLAWLNTLPATDRVMVVRADSLATPATRFETSREIAAKAIRDSQPSSSALHLESAVRFARQLQTTHGKGEGEIVFSGAGRIPRSEAEWNPPKNFRVLQSAGPVENAGIRRIGLRRSHTDPDAWDIQVTVKNYGRLPRSIPVGLQIGGSPAGTRQTTVAPGAETDIAFSYRTRAAAILEARILADDAFPQDDRVNVEIPEQKRLNIAVFTAEPASLAPVLAANPNVAPTFSAPAAYSPDVKADLVILDRFVPAQPPAVHAIYIEPPAAQSPIAVASTRANAKLTRWTEDAVLGAGLRTRDVELATTQIYRTAPADIVVAETDAGPAVVARPGPHRIAVLGFHPPRSRMKFELATPLLFANVIRWMAPGSFRHWELSGGASGAVTARLDGVTSASIAEVRVLDPSGAPIPHRFDAGNIAFFAGSPGVYRAVAGDREVVFSLTVPDIGETVWQAPASVTKGVPRKTLTASLSRDIWYWLALAGGFGLLAEWFLYGRHRVRLRPTTSSTPSGNLAMRKAS